MTIWVTGANGMLGRSIAQQLEAASLEWIGTDTELDIADRDAVERFATEHEFDTLINCAAYTAVDAAETDSTTARRVNATGPGVLAQTCSKHGARFVHFSTDYVFGGKGPEPYREDAEIAPLSVYGKTKAEGEALVVGAFQPPDQTQDQWWILRTSWLFGTGRSSFVDTMWSLMKSKEELRVVDDQIGRPTYVEDLADAALTIANVTSSRARIKSGIYHFANHGPTTWYGFACAIRAAMVDLGEEISVKRIVPVATSEFPRPAPRPAYSVLSTERLEKDAGIAPRDWQSALYEYLKHRAQNVTTK